MLNSVVFIRKLGPDVDIWFLLLVYSLAVMIIGPL